MSRFLWAILRGLRAWRNAALVTGSTGAGNRLVDRHRQATTDGRRCRWWGAVDVAAALVGVAALDLWWKPSEGLELR